MGGGGAGGRRKGLLLLLLALLAAAVLVALLVSAGGSDDEEGRVAGPAAQTATQSTPAGAPAPGPGTATSAAGVAAANGTLTADGDILLGGQADAVAQHIGATAVGRGLQVLSLSTNGFFVGTGEGDRQYVEFGGKVGEDEPNSARPAVGTAVDLTGPVRKAPADPAATLKLDGEDARLVAARGAYINADTVTPGAG